MSTAGNDIGYVEPQPAASARSRYKFRITLEGFMLLIVILLVGFAAWHSGTNLLYLIFSILISLYLVHGFWMSVNLNRLEPGESLPETAIAGQPFDIGVTIRNNKRFASTHAIRLEHRLNMKDAALGAVYFSAIPPQATRENYYSATIPKRGNYTIHTALISTRYPFGFEERQQLRPVDRSVLVLPATYNVATLATSLPFGFGDQDSNIRGTGTELYGLREYVPGEHARHVHWRTSARALKVMVAEFTRDERKQVVLLLDNTISPELRDEDMAERFEKAVTLTASLAKHLINSGFEIGLITGDTTIPIGQGPSHLSSLLRHLAVVSLENPHPIVSTYDSIMQVTYHNLIDPAANKINSLKIDSTQWNPQGEADFHGEKQP